MNSLKGILPIIKPAGYTSHDCVNVVRKLLGIKRVGHTGTLDPSVVGVLPICVGQATRVVEYIQELPKEYIGTLRLGLSTTTEDADGDIVLSQEVSPQVSESFVREVIAGFLGTIEQIPPMFSAVKVDGVRLHTLARQGVEIERKSRVVKIYSIDVLGMELAKPYPDITLRVCCSKGTYIRTLCVDIGKKLGYPAHMKSLQRTKSGPFSLEDCFTFEQIAEYVQAGRTAQLLRPLDTALMQYPAFYASAKQAAEVTDGKRILLSGAAWEDGQLVRIYSPDNLFIALYRVARYEHEPWSKPEKVF
jgi:tRNA pseudouridine55 synthase